MDVPSPRQELDKVRSVPATEIDDAELLLYIRSGAIDQLQAVDLGGVPGCEQAPQQVANPTAARLRRRQVGL